MISVVINDLVDIIIMLKDPKPAVLKKALLREERDSRQDVTKKVGIQNRGCNIPIVPRTSNIFNENTLCFRAQDSNHTPARIFKLKRIKMQSKLAN